MINATVEQLERVLAADTATPELTPRERVLVEALLHEKRLSRTLREEMDAVAGQYRKQGPKRD